MANCKCNKTPITEGKKREIDASFSSILSDYRSNGRSTLESLKSFLDKEMKAIETRGKLPLTTNKIEQV